MLSGRRRPRRSTHRRPGGSRSSVPVRSSSPEVTRRRPAIPPHTSPRSSGFTRRQALARPRTSPLPRADLETSGAWPQPPQRHPRPRPRARRWCAVRHRLWPRRRRTRGGPPSTGRLRRSSSAAPRPHAAAALPRPPLRRAPPKPSGGEPRPRPVRQGARRPSRCRRPRGATLAAPYEVPGHLQWWCHWSLWCPRGAEQTGWPVP
mmetsp:Transcript_159376/g.511333  ORF Transcript_159376/g.511333 Transcript_159376/m.511333 type:complete len:205 (-) Transcript_159376:292-906(-)